MDQPENASGNVGFGRTRKGKGMERIRNKEGENTENPGKQLKLTVLDLPCLYFGFSFIEASFINRPQRSGSII